MPHVIPVKFPFAQRDLWFDPAESCTHTGDSVVCATERGTELGVATEEPFMVSDETLHDTVGDAPLRPVLRKATDEDLDRAADLAAKGEEALPVFRRLAKEQGLAMKPVGVEYLFGGERCVCYFAAEERVDFRQLVRELSRALHERIDMRQIGVREEAALMGGYAGCGQELCCARWERGFEPVSIRMAKEQDLPLNSPKISGVCGRLMCCLRYEFEAYRDFKSRAPKKNCQIITPLGNARIVEYDTPREQLGLRIEGGKNIKVPLAGMECSPAACKKAEENGCPCRPDTVTREMLDALESPDVQMALAELDRANGVVPEEDFDDRDIVFVSEERRRRRRRQVAEQKEEAAAREAEEERRAQRRAEKEAKGGGSSSRRRRRRRSGGAKQEGQAAPNGQGQAAPKAQAPSGEAKAPKREDVRPGRAQRRRHKVADGQGPAGEGPKAKSAPEAPKGGDGQKPAGDAKPKRRRRRRRGKGGGTPSEGAGS